jgi:hypothetical protein
MERDELEDFLEEAISDSLEMDWRPRDGAKSILRALEAAGCQIVQGEPDSWLYRKHDRFAEPFAERHPELVEQGWTETPLFAGKVQP